MGKIYEALEKAQRERRGQKKAPMFVVLAPGERPSTGFEVVAEQEMVTLSRNIDALLPDTPRKMIQFIGSQTVEVKIEVLTGAPGVGIQKKDRFPEPRRGNHGEVPDDGGGSFPALGADELDHFPGGGLQEGVDVPRKGDHLVFRGDLETARRPFPGGNDEQGSLLPPLLLPFPLRLLQRFKDFSHGSPCEPPETPIFPRDRTGSRAG